MSDNIGNHPAAIAYEPIERRRTSDLVADRILDLITHQKLRPGATIPTERELGSAYAVGRSTVREAMRILESQGVITSNSTGSLVVAETGNPLNRSLRLVMSLDNAPDIANLFELRRIIDCAAAEIASVRRQPGDLELMEMAIGEMVRTLAAADADRFIEADVRFHMAVADATGNSLISHTISAIRGVLQEALLGVFHIPLSASRAVGEHRAIFAAIEAGDAGAATAAARIHLDRVESDIRAHG